MSSTLRRSCLAFASATLLAIVFVLQAFPGESQLKGGTRKTAMETAYFAAGCFWKVQYIFSKVPGVIRTRAGYTGGTTEGPTYKDVCSNTTGHAETVQVSFDPDKVSYRKLLETFFANHDPTTLNRQGPDTGNQYRSAIFYTTPEQKEEALACKEELTRSHRFRAPIVTEIASAGTFYDAEDYHQDYVVKHGAACY
jgi:peptide-methionine (S)-S-oxide reductase